MVEAVLFIEVKGRKHHLKIVKFKFIKKHRHAGDRRFAGELRDLLRDNARVERRKVGLHKHGR